MNEIRNNKADAQINKIDDLLQQRMNLVPDFNNQEEMMAYIRELHQKQIETEIQVDKISEFYHKTQENHLSEKDQLLYASVKSAIPDILVITDLQGNVLDLSQNGVEMFGYFNADEGINHNLLEYIIPEDQPRAIGRIGEMLCGSFPGAEEYMGLRKDGTFFEIEVNGQIVMNEKGEPDNFIFIVRDISKRKQEERKLNEINEKYHYLIESVNDAIYEISIDGQILYVSPAIEKILHYKPEEITGMYFFDLLYPDDQEMIIRQFHNLKYRTYPYLEYRYLTKTGEVCWVRSTSTYIEENGIFRKIVGVMSNITHEKTIENALKSSEEKFEKSFSFSPVSLALTSLTDGKFIEINNTFTKTIGYTLEDINENSTLSLNIWDNPADREFVVNSLKNGKEVYAELFKFRTKNGDVIPGIFSATIITINNEPIMLSSHLDISNKVEIERELEEKKEELNLAREIAMIGSWYFDFRTNYYEWSDNNYTMMGIPKDSVELTKDVFMEMLGPDDALTFENKISEMLVTAEQFDVELLLTMKSGKKIWIDNYVIPITEDGRVVAMKGLNIDITASKEAETQINEQNLKLNAIVRAIPDVMFVIDKDGVFDEVFAYHMDMYVIPKSQVIGMNISDIFDEKTLKTHQDSLKKCLKSKTLVSYDYALQVQENELYFEARLVPIEDDKVLVFIRDITEKRDAEKQIHEQNEKLNAIINALPDHLFITDYEGNYTEYHVPNENQIDQIRLTCFDFTGKNIADIFDPEATKLHLDKLKECIETKELVTYEYEVKPPTGGVHCFEGRLIDVGNNSVLRLARNIDERKKFEAELRTLHQGLEDKIKERTIELEQANLLLKEEISERVHFQEALSAKTAELENFFDVSIDLLAIFDKDGNFVKVNKSWCDLLGLPVEEIENKSYKLFVHPEDVDSTSNTSKIGNFDNIYSFVNRYRSGDGSYRYLEWKSTPLDSLNFAAARDITKSIKNSAFQVELLELAPMLTDLYSYDIKNDIQYIIGRIAQFIEADRARVFNLDVKRQLVEVNFEWKKDAVLTNERLETEYPFSIFQDWIHEMFENRQVILNSYNDIPSTWTHARDIIQNEHIQSFIALPLFVENQLQGVISLEYLNNEKRFEEFEINNLKVWGNLISTLIKNEKTERLLEQTRENYETFFNTTDDFIFVLDNDRKIIHLNKTVRERLGYDPEDLIYKGLDAVKPKEYSFLFNDVFNKLDDYLISKEGSLVAVENKTISGFWNSSPVYFEIFKNISEVKRSEEKFSKAFRLNSVLLSITNIETGEIQEVNEAFSKTFGLTYEEMSGKTTIDLNIYKSQEERNIIVDKLKKGIHVRDVETEVTTKSGNVLVFLLSADIIYIGTTRSILTVLVNITQRKKAEEDLKIAKAESESANRAKSEFLSRMSHELRTPMNSILGFAQLLEMYIQDEKQKRGVQHILSNGKHLLNLINEVLDLSRIESGVQQIDSETLNAGNLVDEVVDIVQPIAAKLKVKIDILTKGERFLIRSDRQKLKQILLNLVNNAVKYNKESGNIFISLKKNKTIAEKEMMHFTVTDTGVGISEANIQKLFQPFERIEAEKTGIEGTGLGLSVVKRLVELLDGQFGVESEEGKGSTFWFEVPVNEYDESEVAISEMDNDSDTPDYANGGLILYVEDNVSNLELIQSILELNRPSLKLINSVYGKNVVSMAKMYNPDIVLLDLNLPDIDGYDVLSALAADDETKNIPVVVVSADAMSHRIEKLIQHGAKEYITKPIDVSKFLLCLDKWI